MSRHSLEVGYPSAALGSEDWCNPRHLTDWDRWAHAEYERLEAEEEEEMAHSYGESRDVQRGGAGRLKTRGDSHH